MELGGGGFSMEFSPGNFTGFTHENFEFLAGVDNLPTPRSAGDKEWMDENRNSYHSLKDQMNHLKEVLGLKLSGLDVESKMTKLSLINTQSPKRTYVPYLWFALVRGNQSKHEDVQLFVRIEKDQVRCGLYAHGREHNENLTNHRDVLGEKAFNDWLREYMNQGFSIQMYDESDKHVDIGEEFLADPGIISRKYSEGVKNWQLTVVKIFEPSSVVGMGSDFAKAALETISGLMPMQRLFQGREGGTARESSEGYDDEENREPEEVSKAIQEIRLGAEGPGDQVNNDGGQVAEGNQFDESFVPPDNNGTSASLLYRKGGKLAWIRAMELMATRHEFDDEYPFNEEEE